MIELPYKPRPWQVKAHTGMRYKKTGLLICSRQIGKTWGSIAELCHRTLTGPQAHSTCYLSPAATQARRIAWPRLKEYLAPLQPHVVFKETELVAVLPGDRRIYCLGAESGDNIRGSSFRTIVCDERDSISDEFWRQVMQPTLNAWQDEAFVLYAGTLAGGDSKLWRMYLQHRDDPDWFCLVVPADEAGVFTPEWLASQRAIMGEMAYRREMLCDPAAPVENAVLGEEMASVERDGRIADIPYWPGNPVYTSWDLGVSDLTTVWMYAYYDSWLNVLAYREYQAQGIVDIIASIRSEFRDYVWGEAVLPHDAKNRGIATGFSVRDVFANQWPGSFYVYPSAPSPVSTLNATRVQLQRCRFNKRQCEDGIMRLKSARYVLSPKTGVTTDTILHDINSHGLDAFRYGMNRMEATRPVIRKRGAAPKVVGSGQ